MISKLSVYGEVTLRCHRLKEIDKTIPVSENLGGHTHTSILRKISSNAAHPK